MQRLFLAMGLTIFTGLAWAAPARADVVGPPPALCPDGSLATACHGGPFCSPEKCLSNGQCNSGQVCKTLAYCVEKIGCGGFVEPDADPHANDLNNVKRFCPNGDECTNGATCEMLEVCVAPDTGTGGSASTGGGASTSGGAVDSGGCSCRTPGLARDRDGAVAAGLAALAAALLLRKKRRERRG